MDQINAALVSMIDLNKDIYYWTREQDLLFLFIYLFILNKIALKNGEKNIFKIKPLDASYCFTII